MVRKLSVENKREIINNYYQNLASRKFKFLTKKEVELMYKYRNGGKRKHLIGDKVKLKYKDY